VKCFFKVGDRVNWNSETGRVSGTVTHMHTGDWGGNGYPYHASPEAPQYEIKNSQTEHIAFHTSSTLTKIRG
jgi:hypothetical protein